MTYKKAHFREIRGILDMKNRYLCDVLQEMRKAHETANFSYLPGLIEEAQYMGNRMEAALEDKDDLKRYERKASEMKREKEGLEAKVEKLKAELEDLNEVVEVLKQSKVLLLKELEAANEYNERGRAVNENL
jgi:predicted nuclease with TOPRIM domain